MTTTIAFDRITYKKLRLLAVEKDTNVRDLVRQAVDEYLSQLNKKGGKKP
ncbi:MAG: hypothetical protein IH977_03765 [Nitrospinae bacterium]|nr:hypothetical protein [Nitrospinota bacterium]